MTATDSAAFGELLQAAAQALGKREPYTQTALTMMFGVLQDRSLEEIAAALRAHMRRSSFAPTAADLLEQMDVSVEDRARLAWVRVTNALRSVGTYESVTFDDQACHAAIDRMGGWARLGTLKPEERRHNERDFIQHYSHAVRMGCPDAPAHLAGRSEDDNAAGFTQYHLQRPVAIGPGGEPIRIQRPALPAPADDRGPEPDRPDPKRVREMMRALSASVTLAAGPAS